MLGEGETPFSAICVACRDLVVCPNVLVCVYSLRGTRQMIVQRGEKRCQLFDMFFCARTENIVGIPFAASRRSKGKLRSARAFTVYYTHASMVKSESGGSAF